MAREDDRQREPRTFLLLMMMVGGQAVVISKILVFDKESCPNNNCFLFDPIHLPLLLNSTRILLLESSCVYWPSAAAVH